MRNDKKSACIPGDRISAGCMFQPGTNFIRRDRSPPTLTIDYQVVGSTKNSFMVVVNPKDNANREGVTHHRCSSVRGTIKCKVWFWDDITKADTSFPLDPDKEATMIAVYTSDLNNTRPIRTI